jgi:ketosteroid isomerase-like protein
MRRVLTLVVAALVASSCTQTVDVDQEKVALLAADAEWLKNAKDIDKFTSFMEPDVTLAMASMPALKGPQAVKDALGPMMKAPGFDISWKAEEAVAARSGELGMTFGSYALTINSPAGAPVTEKGKYQTIWKKVNGAWRVIYDAASPDGPTVAFSPAVVTPASAIKWMDAPPFLPKGAKLAVLIGDPSQPAPFTLRLQMPDGYRIAPHTHPTDEHVTVLSGTFRAAMGDKWDDKALTDFAPGRDASASSRGSA